MIAASFSQTYLRNAFNNGFLCIEVPELVKRAARAVCEGDRGERKDDHSRRRDRDRFHLGHDLRGAGDSSRFPPLGSVPQSLVIARGVENLVAKKLGLTIARLRTGSHARSHMAAFQRDFERSFMAKHTVVTMPGDGIGNQVLPEAFASLKAVGFDAEYIHADIGWECWRNEGNALPERTIELLAKHKLGLFGAITSKPKKEAEAELKPELQGKGYSYFSPIVTMRQKFNLDICMRPCIRFPGNPLNFIRKKPDGGFEEPKVNVVVFRQNTEGLYAGVEWTNPPEQVRAALAHSSEVQAVRQRAGRRSGDLGAHHHASGSAQHLRGSFRVRQEVRLQDRSPSAKSRTCCAKPPA